MLPGFPPVTEEGGDAALDHLPKAGQVDIEPLQDADGRAFSFPDDAEQQVLHTDVIVTESQGPLHGCT